MRYRDNIRVSNEQFRKWKEYYSRCRGEARLERPSTKVKTSKSKQIKSKSKSKGK